MGISHIVFERTEGWILSPLRITSRTPCSQLWELPLLPQSGKWAVGGCLWKLWQENTKESYGRYCWHLHYLEWNITSSFAVTWCPVTGCLCTEVIVVNRRTLRRRTYLSLTLCQCQNHSRVLLKSQLYLAFCSWDYMGLWISVFTKQFRILLFMVMCFLLKEFSLGSDFSGIRIKVKMLN